ncbi:hypothetical protein FHW00_004682 [Ochrobactrum sp. P6BSIII]|nr:hypothetical protein [Ochrobactrum sp. P6BSIII]
MKTNGSVNFTQGMTSPRRYAAFARERDELAVNFVLYISDIERFSGTHIPKHPVRGNQPRIGRVANPDNLDVLALKTASHNGFGPSEVDELGAGLELLDKFALSIALTIVNVFALIECDLVIKASCGAVVCHGCLYQYAKDR